MKTINILAVFCIMFCFSLGKSNAQETQTIKYKAIGGIESKIASNLDTIYILGYNPGSHLITDMVPVTIDNSEKTNSRFKVLNYDNSSILNKPVKLNTLTGEPSLPGFEIEGTFNGRWLILTPKSGFSANGNYYHQVNSRKTIPSDYLVYRLAAGAFNFYKTSTYRTK
jgi:hypothetical protein